MGLGWTILVAWLAASVASGNELEQATSHAGVGDGHADSNLGVIKTEGLQQGTVNTK